MAVLNEFSTLLRPLLNDKWSVWCFAHNTPARLKPVLNFVQHYEVRFASKGTSCLSYIISTNSKSPLHNKGENYYVESLSHKSCVIAHITKDVFKSHSSTANTGHHSNKIQNYQSNSYCLPDKHCTCIVLF